MKVDDETKGRAKGGKARADKLTSEQRSEIAKKGAIARWGYEATHKGNFEDEFGIDVDCYVLNDGSKTAVISQRGMGKALGLGDSGAALPSFVNGKTISKVVGVGLLERISKPLIFKDATVGVGLSQPRPVNGYDVTILIDICKAIVKAESEGKLLSSQSKIAKQAHIILGASAKAGIQGLVYALSGYDRTKEEIITAFKLFVQDEAQKYESEFPNQLYEEWYRLYRLPKPERNRPWKFMHLTNEHVYFPLANSSGKLHELVVMQRAKKKEDRNKRLFQFLSEIGVKALRTHLGQLLGIAKISKTQAEYEGHVQNVFGVQKTLDLR
jgi:hypothetical protein